MQACYFDENRQIDAAGAALIKTVGIYSPGSLVRLSTNEIAVVTQRGSNTTTPKVAVLINRNGMPTGELIVRDTSQRDYKIVASVPHREVKVQISLERLLPLTKVAASMLAGSGDLAEVPLLLRPASADVCGAAPRAPMHHRRGGAGLWDF